MDFLNTGIITIIAACCIFAGLKALIDWLRTKGEGERKHLTFLFVLLFVVNLAVLWLVAR
jgi:predicted PurR-regulated permease PerM